MDGHFYRYMSIKKLKDFLTNGKIVFAYPSNWKDPFEKYFVDADYGCLGFKKPATYCACFTQKRENESSWISYSYYNSGEDRHSARVLFDMKLFLELLNSKSYKTTINFRLGLVSYELQERSIMALGKRNSKYYKEAFENFSLDKYADLLLIKRKAFESEVESRLIITVEDDEQDNEGLEVGLDSTVLHNVVKEVTIDPICSPAQAKRIINEIKGILNDDSIPVSQSKLYNTVSPLIIEVPKK